MAEFDPWIDGVAPELSIAATPTDLLTIETIDDIEPLDAQFGVHPKKTVPDILYAPLFGQPEPTEAEIAAAGGDPANIPPMNLYAILDAAKVEGLLELLENSELEHRCLFQGEPMTPSKTPHPGSSALKRTTTSLATSSPKTQMKTYPGTSGRKSRASSSAPAQVSKSSEGISESLRNCATRMGVTFGFVSMIRMLLIPSSITSPLTGMMWQAGSSFPGRTQSTALQRAGASTGSWSSIVSTDQQSQSRMSVLATNGAHTIGPMQRMSANC